MFLLINKEKKDKFLPIRVAKILKDSVLVGSVGKEAL